MFATVFFIARGLVRRSAAAIAREATCLHALPRGRLVNERQPQWPEERALKLPSQATCGPTEYGCAAFRLAAAGPPPPTGGLGGKKGERAALNRPSLLTAPPRLPPRLL